MIVKNSVYRDAAEVVARKCTTFSCLAVGYKSPKELRTENIYAYEKLFFPPAKLNRTSRFHNPYEPGDAWGDRWGETDEERRDCRILALLFMHEITNC